MPPTSSVMGQMMAFTAHKNQDLVEKRRDKAQCVSMIRCKDLFKQKIIWGYVHFNQKNNRYC